MKNSRERGWMEEGEASQVGAPKIISYIGTGTKIDLLGQNKKMETTTIFISTEIQHYDETVQTVSICNADTTTEISTPCSMSHQHSDCPSYRLPSSPFFRLLNHHDFHQVPLAASIPHYWSVVCHRRGSDSRSLLFNRPGVREFLP